MNVITSQGLVSALAGEEAGEQWNDVSGYLFEILGTFLILSQSITFSLRLVIFWILLWRNLSDSTNFPLNLGGQTITYWKNITPQAEGH